MQDYIKGFIHDFRTSLGVVISCLDPENGEAFKKIGDLDHLEMAKRQAEKAVQLVSDLEGTIDNEDLVTSTTVSASMINVLLEQFINLYPNVRVRFKCPEEFMVFTDTSILKRVIDNCISNSVVAGKAPWVLLSCECDGEILTIYVKDGGCGMDKRQLQRIGLGFSTTGGGKGTRILLYLLSRAGGVAHWESIPDVGTCVSISFAAIESKKNCEDSH